MKSPITTDPAGHASKIVGMRILDIDNAIANTLTATFVIELVILIEVVVRYSPMNHHSENYSVDGIVALVVAVATCVRTWSLSVEKRGLDNLNFTLGQLQEPSTFKNTSVKQPSISTSNPKATCSVLNGYINQMSFWRSKGFLVNARDNILRLSDIKEETLNASAPEATLVEDEKCFLMEMV